MLGKKLLCIAINSARQNWESNAAKKINSKTEPSVLTFSLSHPKILDGPFLPAQIRSLKGSRPGATGHPVRRHSDIGIQVFLFHVVNRHEMSPEKLTWHGDFLLNDAQVFVHAR